MMKKAGVPPSDFEDFISHEPADPWWDHFGYIKDTDRFDRNLNTARNNFYETMGVIAKNTVYHTKKYPSHIILPIIR